MWNSRVGLSRAASASTNTSSRLRVYAPSSLGILANEQNTHVLRRMQTLVGLLLHRVIRRRVEIAGGIRGELVDRRRDDAIAQRERADRQLERAGGAEQVAG